MENVKVYGIHTGCMFEGGSTQLDLYEDYENARQVALLNVAKCQEEDEELYKGEDSPCKTWKEVRKDRWNNGLDCVELVEYNLFLNTESKINGQDSDVHNGYTVLASTNEDECRNVPDKEKNLDIEPLASKTDLKDVIFRDDYGNLRELGLNEELASKVVDYIKLQIKS
jgi:hypothetical protein